MMCTKKTDLSGGGKKILILRSGPQSLLRRATLLCRKMHRGCSVTVLVQETFCESANESNPDRLMLSHKDGRFTIFHIGRQKIERLRGEKFDIIVLLYNNPWGRECVNIDMLGLSLGRNVWIFDSNERYYPLRGKRWLFLILPFRFFASILKPSLLLVIFPLLSVLYLVSALFRLKKSATRNLAAYGG